MFQSYAACEAQFVCHPLCENWFYCSGENDSLYLPSIHCTTHVVICIRVSSRRGSYVLCGLRCLKTWLHLIHLCILSTEQKEQNKYSFLGAAPALSVNAATCRPLTATSRSLTWYLNPSRILQPWASPRGQVSLTCVHSSVVPVPSDQPFCQV